MTDIASLGFKVDSTGIIKATRSLDELEKQGGKTEKTTETLGKTSKKTGDSVKGLGDKSKKAGEGVDGLGRSNEDTARSTDKLRKSTSLLSGLMAGFSVAAVVGGLRSSVLAYAEQEQAVRQLEARIKSTGGAAGLFSDDLQGMASALQQTTVYGDEAIIGMQSLLLTFTQISGSEFIGAQEAILNVSTALGTDLKSSALQVGKALNDPILGLSALSRSGIQFTESQKDVVRALVDVGDTAAAQNIILKELEVQFGGAAEAAAGGTGMLKQISNAFGDVSEQAGEMVITNSLVIAGMEGMLAAGNALAGNTSLAEWAKDTNYLFIGIAATAETVKVGFTNVGLSLGALVAAGSLAASGNFSLIGGVFEQLSIDLEQSNAGLLDTFKQLGGVEVATVNVASATKLLGVEQQKVTGLTTKQKKEIKALGEANDKLRKSDLDIIAALKLEQKQLKLNDRELRESNALRKLSAVATDEQRQEITGLIQAIYEEEQAIQNAKNSALAAAEEQKDQQLALQKTYEDTAEKINDSFTNAFRTMLDGGEDVFDNLVSSAKSMIKDIIAELLTLSARPFIVSIVGAGAGLSGGQASADGVISALGGQSGGGSLSDLSSLSNLSGSSIGASFQQAGSFLNGGSVGALGPNSAGIFQGAAGYSNLAYGGVSLVAGLIGQELFGGMGGTGASLGATIGLAAGGPIGAAIGGVLGGAVGGLFGGDAAKPKTTITPTLLSESEYAAYALGRGGSTNLLGARTLSDDDAFGVAESQFGNYALGTQHDVFKSGGQEAVDNLFNFIDGVTAAENLLAATLSDDTLQRVNEANMAQDRSRVKNKIGIDAFLSQRLETTFNEIGGTVDALFDRLADGLDDATLANNASSLISTITLISEGLRDGALLFGDGLTDSLTNRLPEDIDSMLDLFSELATESESVGQAYIRLTTETAVYKHALDAVGLTFHGTAEEMIRFSDDFSTAAGGLQGADVLWEQYYTSFYSDQERAAQALDRSSGQLADFLAGVGLDGIGLTVDNFRVRFEAALDGGLGAAAAVDWLSAGQFLTQVQSLSNELGSDAEDVGLSATDRLISAKSGLIDAYKREISEQKNIAAGFRDIGASLREAGESLVLSDLSPLTNAQRLAEARSEFESVANRARLGDEEAMGQLAAASEAFLTESRTFNASSSRYTSDFNLVRLTLSETGATSLRAADAATRTVTELERQFDELSTQNGWLEQINTGVITLASALGAWQTANAVSSGGLASGGLSDSAFVNQLYTDGFGREADAGGLRYWIGQLAQGDTRQHVVDSFSASEESGFDASGIRMFANGGRHSGGLRIVGEQGAELEYTGSSFISSHSDMQNLFNTAPIESRLARVEAAVMQVVNAINTQSDRSISAADQRAWRSIDRRAIA